MQEKICSDEDKVQYLKKLVVYIQGINGTLKKILQDLCYWFIVLLLFQFTKKISNVEDFEYHTMNSSQKKHIEIVKFIKIYCFKNYYVRFKMFCDINITSKL